MAATVDELNTILADMGEAVNVYGAMADGALGTWDPAVKDPRRLHNMYIQNLVACYSSKFALLTAGVGEAIHTENFFVYALSGRSLLEITAMLRYYMRHKYAQLFSKGSLSAADLRTLIEVDETHLRGSRFEWKKFLGQDQGALRAAVEEYLRDKRRGKKREPSAGEQVSVQTCVEKWASDDSDALVAYNLFCDLVHPNVGSSLLAASITDDGAWVFDPKRGNPVGRVIVAMSLPLLWGCVRQPFEEHLVELMLLKWQEEELS